MENINHQDLYPMDMFAGRFPLTVNLAYAHDRPPNIFGPVYAPAARLWLHRDLARIVLLAACLAHKNHQVSFVLYDGLRTSDAQDKMARSPIVKANPSWMEEPRLLSPPGSGAHPRGMAIDIALLDQAEALLDMGTDFDHLSPSSHPDQNPAHRAYKALSPQQSANRHMLDDAMARAAAVLDLPLLPLPQEWWDFRMPPDIYNVYAPLADADLPPEMRMVKTETIADFNAVYAPRVDKLAADIETLT
ncbi:MAG: D-Ala-D-Ala dipeptidase [Micavibrio sp.]|nr:D-Ala-D-Ala dipeptidase [Micavibrio sp.]|tara:strand:- start:963 stop:1703 length:741 start_codon:yes stop_codon:yes gene_type:complete